MAENYSFGYWLRRQRLARDLRQVDLAAQLRIAPITLRKIEADERRASLQLIARIVEVFDLAQEERALLLRVARADISPAALTIADEAHSLSTIAPAQSEVALPSGTVTFLFTDIAGSTQLWERYPAAMRESLTQHDTLLHTVVKRHGGVVVKGMGDGLIAAFALAEDAFAAALDGQRSLAATKWNAIGPLQVRMALHSGAAEVQAGDYLGPTLNRTARLLAAGHGGQILLSLVSAELLRDQLPADVYLRDLGAYRLKDLTRPEHILQVVTPDLPSDFPPLRTLDHRQHNLPAQTTALIGREQEIADLSALLQHSEVRLVTLIGPGGTGKTRLALQTTAELIEQFPDGAWFVDLAPVNDPALVVPAIAQSIGVRQHGAQSLLETVQAALRNQRVLLLLDNFEHVVAAAPEIGTLLAHTAQLTVLVTSREALHISGERLVAVPPLQLPDLHILDRVNTELAPLVSQYDAVRLFIERAQTVRADFTVTNANAPAVAAICVRLDGLPLAIELAAARIRLLSPEALLARLERRLQVLTSGPRDRPDRQQTLRGAIAWSYDLLGTGEQRLFRSLGVFSGGCSLAAVDRLADGEMDGMATLDVLSSLVDKSLLRQVDGPEGEPRFLMLETVREYALEQLQSAGELEQMQALHGAFVRDLGSRIAPHLRGSQQLIWLRHLDAEYANVREALRWLADRRDQQPLADLCSAVWQFWWLRGHWAEGRNWLARALNAPVEQLDAALRCRLLAALGWIQSGLSDFEAAQQALAESCTMAQTQGDRRSEADAWLGLALVGYGEGDYHLALDHLTRALDAYREVDDRRGIAQALSERGFMRYILGDLNEALAENQEALTIARGGGFQSEIALALEGIGLTHIGRGNFEAAHAAISESLTIRREPGDRHKISGSLNWLGEVAYNQAAYQQAEAYWLEALELRRKLGNRRGAIAILVNLCRGAWRSGDVDQAVRWLRKAASDSREIAYHQGDHWILFYGAYLAINTGALRRATQLLGAAESLGEALNLPMWPENLADYEEALAQLRAMLDEQALTDEWATGRALSLEEALELACR